jgi:hypothetical protein
MRYDLRKRCVQFVLSTAATLVAVAPALAQPGSPDPRAGREPPRARSLDHEFADLTTRVPGGFGGWFYDQEGRPNVYLVDTTKRAGAVTALLPVLRDRQVSVAGGQRNRPDVANIVILQGQYDFATLLNWRGQIDGEAPRIPGITMTDVQERTNRVVVGVESEAAGVQVREALARLNIPIEAVQIVQRPRDRELVGRGVAPWATQTGTLAGNATTVAAGYRINWYSGGWRWCTLGFNAERWNATRGAYDRVFGTNTHCSNAKGSDTNQNYYQGGTTSTYLIGVEHLDPPFVPGTEPVGCEYTNNFCCPSNASCREGDSLLGLWSQTRWGFGLIARPVPPGSTSPLTVDPNNSPWRINAEKGFSEWGEDVEAVGATSGWRRGKIEYTCVRGYADGGRQYYCEDDGTFNGTEGDSGGPVFSLNPAQPGYVTFRGIFRGSGGTFVTVSALEWDLGDLYFF